MNAYAYDINKCLFRNWMVFNKKQPAVLCPRKVRCSRRQLCYNPDDDGIAQFAVCYNRQKNIPEFSGHILHPNHIGGGGRDGFRKEASIGNFLLSLLYYFLCFIRISEIVDCIV